MKLHVLELEEKMEAGVDTANAQLLFMASTLDHSLEQLAQKDKKKGKKAFWVQGGKPAVLTDEAMIDALECEEAQKLAKEAEKETKKAAAANKKLQANELKILKKLREEAWETAKLNNETVLMSWKAAKLEACRIGSGVPPKPPLALQKDVYKLLEGSNTSSSKEVIESTEEMDSSDQEGSNEEEDD